MNRIITRELVAVISVVGLASMAMSLLQPVLPIYLTSLGISPTILGLMFSAGMAGMVFGESAGGWIADRVGIKVPLLIGTFVCAPMVLSFVFLTHPAAIFAIFFVWGIVRAAIFGPGRGYIGTNIPLAHKATFMAVYATAMAVSRGLGSFTSGFIVDNVSYAWVFYAATTVGVVGGVVVLISLRNSRAKTFSPVTNHAIGTPEKSVALYHHRPFIFQSAIALFYFAAIGLSPFLSLLAAEVAGLPATQVGILFTISAVANAALLVPMGRLADHKSKRSMMIAGLLIVAAGQAVVGFSRGFPQLAVGVIVQAAGGAMFGPAAVALLSENIPPDRQSTAMGVYGGSEDAGVILGSAVAGVVWSALGPAPTFLLVGSLSAVIGAVMAFALLKKPVAVAVKQTVATQ